MSKILYIFGVILGGGTDKVNYLFVAILRVSPAKLKGRGRNLVQFKHFANPVEEIPDGVLFSLEATLYQKDLFDCIGLVGVFGLRSGLLEIGLLLLKDAS